MAGPVDFDCRGLDCRAWLTDEGDLAVIGPDPSLDVTVPREVLEELGLTTPAIVRCAETA